MTHCICGSGEVECIMLLVKPARAAGLPTVCGMLAVSVLGGEMLRRAVALPQPPPADDEPGGRLLTVLLDKLGAALVEQLALPLPTDTRLKQVLEQLLAARLANRDPLPQWASRAAMSERSFSRLLRTQTGLSFGRWKRQLQVLHALSRLSWRDRAGHCRRTGLRKRQQLRHDVSQGAGPAAGTLPGR